MKLSDNISMVSNLITEKNKITDKNNITDKNIITDKNNITDKINITDKVNILTDNNRVISNKNETNFTISKNFQSKQYSKFSINNSISQINEEIELKKIKNLKFSLFQHFRKLIPCCCCFVNRKLSNRYSNFEELISFTIKYFDILEIVKKLHEFERLKYVVFSKKQIALFNYVNQPSNPLIYSTQLNFITERLKFDNDLEKQKKILESLFELNNFKDDKFTKRLLKLNFNKKSKKT